MRWTRFSTRPAIEARRRTGTNTTGSETSLKRFARSARRAETRTVHRRQSPRQTTPCSDPGRTRRQQQSVNPTGGDENDDGAQVMRQTRADEERYISPTELANRWRTSRSTVDRIARAN